MTTAYSTAAVGVSFVLGVVLARELGPSGKGEVDLAVATAYLGALLFSFSLGSGFMFATARGSDPLKLLIVAVLSAAVVTGMAVLALAIVSGSSLAGAFIPEVPDPPITLMGLGAGAYSLLVFVQSILAGLGLPARGSAFVLTGRAATLGLLATAVILGSSGTLSLDQVLALVVLGWLMTGALGAIAIWQRRGGEGIPSRAVTSFSLRSYAYALVQFGNQRLDLFIVALIVGAHGLGIYVVSASVAQLLWIPANSAAQVIVPAVARDRARLPLRTARVTIAVTTIAAGVLVLVAPFAVPLLFGSDFQESVLPLLVLIPGALVYAWGRLMSAYLTGVGRPHLNAVGGSVGLLATIVLDLLLIPPLGILGAALASTVSYLVVALAVARFYRISRGASGTEVLPQRGDFRAALQRIAGASSPR